MNVDQVRHLGEIRARTDAVLAWIHGDGSTNPPEPQWMDFWDDAPENAAWLLALVDDLVAENERLHGEAAQCEACGHVQGEPNWCHECGHRTTFPEWAVKAEQERVAERALTDRIADALRFNHPTPNSDGLIGGALAAYDAARGERNPE